MATKAAADDDRRVYYYKSGSRFPVPAQIAGNALEEIREQNPDRKLEPRDVVETASDPDHALHRCFNWDDETASNAWRMQQARQLIGAIHVKIQFEPREDPKPIFYYAHTEQRQQGYRPIHEVMGNEDYRNIVLAEALAALRGLRMRYGQLKELSSVWESLDQIPMPSAARKTKKKSKKVKV